MAKTDAINKCQYWHSNEPTVCTYWDVDNTICTYATDNPAAHAPYCNLLGTAVDCIFYNASSPGDVKARCILPDPRRHVCNRATGKKWVTAISGTGVDNDSGHEILDWDFDVINGYNEGECDGVGTDTTCSGYSPYHMGFGTLQPSDSLELDTFESGHFSIASEFGYRLPTNFTIYNIRAKLSRCYWWKTDPGIFMVSDEGIVELKSNWACSCPKDTSAYSEFTHENGPPCNGCKPECRNYTGVCWKYCIDEKMEDGDPILAEQIHELRYYHREHNWTKEAIQAIFMDEGDIFAWHGTADSGKCGKDAFGAQTDPDCVDGGAGIRGIIATTVGSDGRLEDYRIPAVKVSMPSFDEFTIETQSVELTQGIAVVGKLNEFPTLVRALQLLPLSPIIQTEFNKYVGGNGEEGSLFETSYLVEGISALIYGKLFYSTTAYAINISDSEVQCILPAELYFFDNIYDMQMWLSAENYEIFKEKLYATLNAIKAIDGDKVIANSLPREDRTFLMDVPVLTKDKIFDNTNNNTILVFQEVNGVFTFDKVTFTKRVVGGMLFQDDFQILGDDGKVRRTIPNFEKSFGTFMNSNGSMSFYFQPFVDAGLTTKASYTFNDVYHKDPISMSNYTGSTTYKIIIPQYILELSTTPGTPQELKAIGSNGYCLIKLNDLCINNVIENWEAEKIVITYGWDTVDTEGNITTEYTECEMEIAAHGGDRKLSSGQVLIKPKNMENFSSICYGNTTVEINDLTYLEKRSFNEPPNMIQGSYEDINADDEYLEYLEAGEFDGGSEQFTIMNYKFVLTLATVMQDSTGRPFTMSRTKPIGMVKQAACPDVEIYYKWTAVYDWWQNLPICTCCGARSEVFKSTGSLRANAPQCGDHFECSGCYPAAMWWPYNDCQGYATYNQVTNLDNYDLSIIGLFREKDADGLNVHGQHDMRMLGPHKRYASPWLYCPPKPCSCPMLTFNSYMIEDPYFSGYGRVRAGVSNYQIKIWEETGSDPILQFGNELRSVLRSYRTMDQAPYIRTDGEKPVTDWHLMPAAQMFSRADITADTDPIWDFFCTSKGPRVINPLGFYLANEFDGIDINEEIDYNNRFRFEDIITVQNEFNLGYPKTVGQYVSSIGESIVTPIYNFKPYPVGGGNTIIQWAWQEAWKPIERNNNVVASMSYGDFITQFMDKGFVGGVKGTYLDLNGDVFGSHKMIDLAYPDYKYDYQNKEFRLVCDETVAGDTSIIKFKAPQKDANTGEYLGYPSLQLNDGPKRGINWAGEWLTQDNADGELADGESLEEDYNVILYDKCIGKGNGPTEEVDGVEVEIVNEYIHSGWSEAVTLFDTGYDDESASVAKDEERLIATFDMFGDSVMTYFQRGLNVSLFVSALGRAPLRFKYMSQFTQIGGLMEVVCGIFNSLNIGLMFDNVKRTIGKFSFSYEYGPKLVSQGTSTTSAVYNYFHGPELFVYRSCDGVTGDVLLYSSQGMKLYDGPKDNSAFFEVRNETVEWENTWDYVVNGDLGLYVEFRVTPTSGEIAAMEAVTQDSGRYDRNLNSVNALNMQVYEEVLTDGNEHIFIHERKYYVSHGTSGDGPPQGEPGQKALTALPMFAHSVWQVDGKDGVDGISNSSGEHIYVNKCRGRFVFDTYEDLTVLDSGSMAAMENLQYKLYNQAALKATETSTMKGVLPPGLQELLTKNGVTFVGSGGLALKNSLVSTLGAINQFPIMQGEGHSYIASNPWTEACSGGNHCYGGDTFAWRYTCFDEKGDSHTAIDSLTQYSMGTYYMMQRREMAYNLSIGLHVRWYSRSTGNGIYQDKENAFSTLRYPAMYIRYISGGHPGVVVPVRGNPSMPMYWGGMWGSSIEPMYGYNTDW